jgi:diguanylate cyclase (GGDEF)-like protein
MKFKELSIKIATCGVLSLSTFALGYAIYAIQIEKLDYVLLCFAAVTVFFSSILRIQLPRTQFCFTISDAMIFVAIMVYGCEVAIILSFLESLYCSLSLYFSGGKMRKQTIFLNVAISVSATFLSSQLVHFLLADDGTLVSQFSFGKVVPVLIGMTLIQFVTTASLMALFVSHRTNCPLLQSWQTAYSSFFVMYIAGAVFAGLIVFGINQVDFILIIAAIAFVAIAYLTYRSYLTKVAITTTKVENAETARAEAEKLRAEQAEHHVKELEVHIAEQERISKSLRESKEKFRHVAFHDSLTDLPNRNYFLEEVKYVLEKTKIMPRNKFAVLFLDINRFKTVNDSLGHAIGDRLILNVGKRIKSAIRKGDMVARFSGDEFAILLSDVDDLKDVEKYAELIQKRIAVPITLNGRQVFTSVSIGIALSDDSYKEAQDILRDADIAMYQAKAEKKPYTVFAKSMHTETVSVLQLDTDLRYAVAREEFCVYYQPIINLETMRLIGFEALMRWNHPQRGLVPPYEFIPACEETGLIIPMTLWILREACLQTKRWQDYSQDTRNLMISVNLSGKHFSQPDLIEQIWKILSETDFNPGCLKLEITESAVMENAEDAVLLLKKLKELGIQLSIDDFGTGYSSLSYLNRFPIDTLKVDRSFVTSMSESSENGELVRAIITLSHALGIEVVAEGIETVNQLHQLRILNCELGQGYLFSRPVPTKEAELLVRNASAWAVFAPAEKMKIPETVTTHPVNYLN